MVRLCYRKHDPYTDCTGRFWLSAPQAALLRKVRDFMKKFFRTLTLCLMALMLVCSAVPAAFAAEDTDTEQDPPNTIYTIGLDACGGTCSTVVVYTTLAGKLRALPEQPVLDGYSFLGWYTEPVGGTKVTTSTVFTEDTTLYAHWSVKESASSSAPAVPAPQFELRNHLGTFLIAGILLTTLAAAAAM